MRWAKLNTSFWLSSSADIKNAMPIKRQTGNNSIPRSRFRLQKRRFKHIFQIYIAFGTVPLADVERLVEVDVHLTFGRIFFYQK